MTSYDYPEHYADNIYDAIALAEELKESGKYDLFRGQTECFQIIPSASRDGVNPAAVIEKLNEFANWVHDTHELASLQNNIPAITAVAQHYGLKTPYLDFTHSPEIAGFFATDGSKVGDTGTIICINKERFQNSWADLNKSYLEKEGSLLTDIIEVDVKNLWRLQAQEGVFLDCRVDPNMLEMFSHFLHIYFPQEDNQKIIDSSNIYPSEKSHLEVYLDKYFLIDSYPQREADLLKIFGTKIEVQRRSIEDDLAPYFINESLPDIHKSWTCLLYTSPSPRDQRGSRMPSSA